jgi:hypothetical protein
MNRDDLVGQLAAYVGQGMRVPEEAFRLADTIDLQRFKGLSVHTAATMVLRMGLQKRFRFFSVRPSVVEREINQLFGASSKVERKLAPMRLASGLHPLI